MVDDDDDDDDDDDHHHHQMKLHNFLVDVSDMLNFLSVRGQKKGRWPGGPVLLKVEGGGWYRRRRRRRSAQAAGVFSGVRNRGWRPTVPQIQQKTFPELCPSSKGEIGKDRKKGAETRSESLA